jgi:hypothetical protein
VLGRLGIWRIWRGGEPLCRGEVLPVRTSATRPCSPQPVELPTRADSAGLQLRDSRQGSIDWWSLQPLSSPSLFPGCGASGCSGGVRKEYSACRERSAPRLGVAIALLAAEIAILSIAGSKAGSPLAFVTSWLALVLMPGPTPRLLLVTGRLLAAVKRVGVSQRRCVAGNDDLGAGWFQTAVSPIDHLGNIGHGGRSECAGERNVPRITFSSVGGGNLAKREIRLAAANRFAGGQAQVVRNGVRLYGPSGRICELG